jgi:hypothetical protein
LSDHADRVRDEVRWPARGAADLLRACFASDCPDAAAASRAVEPDTQSRSQYGGGEYFDSMKSMNTRTFADKWRFGR